MPHMDPETAQCQGFKKSSGSQGRIGLLKDSKRANFMPLYGLSQTASDSGGQGQGRVRELGSCIMRKGGRICQYVT